MIDVGSNNNDFCLLLRRQEKLLDFLNWYTHVLVDADIHHDLLDFCLVESIRCPDACKQVAHFVDANQAIIVFICGLEYNFEDTRRKLLRKTANERIVLCERNMSVILTIVVAL